MSNEIHFHGATQEDLLSIVRLLADDGLGSGRERYENPLADSYIMAFEQIANDPSHELIVAEKDGEVMGTLHLIYIPSISFMGGLRAQIESVRIDRKFRGSGYGSRLINWAIEKARKRGASLVQLTTHKSREDAHRFYEHLGFHATHIGMKLNLK